MISNLHISNFKSFGKTVSTDISDLTIIAGANSGGKSTIIQMILLLAQTLENPRADVALDLGGRFVQFAEFREIVFARPKNAQAEFIVEFELNTQENDLRDIRTILLSKTQLSSLSDDNLIVKTKNHYHVSIGFKANPSGIPFVNFCKYKKIINDVGIFTFDVQKQSKKHLITYTFQPAKKSKIINKKIENIKQKLLEFNQGNEKTASNPSIRSLQRILDNILGNFPHVQLEDINRFTLRTSLLRLPKSQSAFFEQLLSDIQSLFLQSSLTNSNQSQARFEHFLFTVGPPSQLDIEENVVFDRFNEHFRVANNEIKRFLRSLQYIGPLRAKPERAYLSAGTPVEIGNAGENAVPILWVNQNEKVFSKVKIGEKPKETKLAEATEEWIRQFGISGSFHITKPKRVIYQAELESNPGSNIMVTIADVGFGVSQLLPVIVAGLWARTGSTLILEQPEIHLHPRLQGKLADFLICMAELDKKIIVETHSEHLINMLRLRIVQDSTGGLQSKIGILFVRPPQQGVIRRRGSSVESLKVDEYGKIVNWPSDFFPESTEVNEKILRAMFDKPTKGEEK